MTERDEPPLAGAGEQASDAVERLLRLAGSRPVGDADRMRRVRGAVQDAWLDSVRRRTRRRLAIGFGALAAAAALVIAVSVSRRTDLPAPAPQAAISAARLTVATGGIAGAGNSGAVVSVGDMAMVGAAFETGSGALATFALVDGGEMRMNERTVVRFTAAREIRVDRGAIYLDSGPRRGSIVVQTPVGVVRDLGTRFEVADAGGSWRVRVREGLVRYEGPTPHEAGAGGELIVESTGRVVERPSPTYGADWAWVVRAAPTFQVEGQTLAAFLDWVARESGRHVEFSNDELRRTSSGIILHGAIDRLTPEEALDVILPTCGLAHQIDSQRVIVSKPEGTIQ